MTDRTDYLKEQIARCERLTKSIADELTIERLLALAAECREELAIPVLRENATA